tara:strand:- start:301 stop:822 length:522 start_codon:yes stop_codon:yes gene_type:complete
MKLKIYSFKKVKSTNDTALRFIKKNIINGVITSETQKNGRGKYGKNWVSNKGNLFMSIFFPIEKKITIKKFSKINLKIIKNIFLKNININVTVKQPNDILIRKKKVCGVLQEIAYNNNDKILIIGIGINIINSPNIKDYETTYLNKYFKKELKLMNLIKIFKNTFEKNHSLYA